MKNTEKDFLKIKTKGVGLPYFYSYASFKKLTKGNRSSKDVQVEGSLKLLSSKLHNTESLDQKKPYKPIVLI